MTDTAKLPQAAFYDGVTAQEHPVQITLFDHGIKIVSASMSVPEEWAYADMRIVADLANHKGTSFRVLAGLGRLNVQNEALAARLKKLAPNLKKSDIPASAWQRVGLWGGGAIASVVLIVLVIIPALANQLATLIPVEREIALGRTSLKQIESFLGYIDDKPLICSGKKGQQALDKMTARISQNLNSPYPLVIKVFNNEIPNAFAVPGGHVVLFDGLIQEADSPEEVAAVLGHELGHVINRDPTRLTLRSAGSVGILGMVLGDFAGGAAALVIAEQLIAANYSQKAETDADAFAHSLMADAKLPSGPMAAFFDRLDEEYGSEPDLLSHLASHPDLTSRAQAANDANTIGDKPFKAVLSTSEWDDLRHMCNGAEKPKSETPKAE